MKTSDVFIFQNFAFHRHLVGRTYASADPFPPKPEQSNPAKKYVSIDAGKYTYLAEGILKVLGLRLEDLQLRKLLGLFEHHVERAAGGGNCRQGSRWLKCRRRGGGDGQESKGVEFHTWISSQSNLIGGDMTKWPAKGLLLALALRKRNNIW